MNLNKNYKRITKNSDSDNLDPLLLLLQQPEHDIVQVEGVLDDARGGDPGSEDVLLSGQIVRILDTIQIR